MKKPLKIKNDRIASGNVMKAITAAALVMFFGVPLGRAQTLYYDRASFLSDSNVATTSSINFDSLSPGTDLNNQTLSGVTFSAPGSSPLAVIAGSVGVRYPMSPSTGLNVLSPGGSDPSLQDDGLSVVFNNPVQAAGMDVVFDVPDGASYVGVTFYDASNNIIAQNNFIPCPNGAPGYQFVGLVANSPMIKQIVFDDFDASPPDDNVAYDSLIFSSNPENAISTITGHIGVAGSVEGIGTNAQFNTPHDVAVDGAGNVYVADQINHTIRELTLVGTNWVSATIAGQAGAAGSADGSGTNALFNNPSGVAVDGGGNVFVADEGNHTIRELTLTGTNWNVSTIAGAAGNAGSADGLNGAARFNSPSGLAVDANDDVYVADWGSHTIRELIPSGTNWNVITIAGLAGNKGTANGANSAARFNHPEDVAVAGIGNVYVADWGNHAIRELMLSGTNWNVSTIAGVAGNTNYGSADGVGSAARFYYPSGLALDSAGNIYVADTFNDTIRKMTLAGENWTVSTIAGMAGVAGSADGTGGSARFYNPCGVAVDSSNNLFVADTGNQTVRLLSLLSPSQTNLSASAYDPAAQFSAASNPSGVWSYGYSLTLGSPLILYLEKLNYSGVDAWRTNISSGDPLVEHNPTANAISIGTSMINAGGLILHPGPNDEYSITRFTAPAAGLYHVTGSFFGADTVGTTTDVHILTNGVPVFNGAVNGFGPGTGPSFDTNVFLNAGDFLDFAVGYGNNGFSYDSTGLSAQIAPVLSPVISSQPQSLTMTNGSPAGFTVTAFSTSPLFYQWQKNGNNLTDGGNISGSATSNLFLNPATINDAGNYSVIITNSAGSVTSSVAALTVSGIATPPPPGLISWWRVESNALDSVGTNNGTLVGGVTYTNGEVGQAFNLDGTSGFVVAPASASLNVGLASGLTIEGWIDPASTAAEQPIVEWNNGSADGVHLWISVPPSIGTGPGCLYANVVDTTGASHYFASPAGLIAANTFQHVALTYDTNSGVAVLYINGVSVAQQNLGVFTPQTSYSVYLGDRPGGPTPLSFYGGLLDEISIYNRALSSNEISAIYAAGSAGKISNQPYFLTATNLPNGGAGVSYSQTITASVTTGNTFSLIGGLLPAGLNLSTNGLISGTPATAGTNGFTILATSSLGQTNSQTFTLVTSPAQNLLVNGGFESEPNWDNGIGVFDPGETELIGNQIPGWTIVTNHAVTIHISPGPYLTISGNYSANTDGEGYMGHNANFYQDFASQNGASYALEFNWQSWGSYGTPTTNKLEISLIDSVTTAVLFDGLYSYDGTGQPHLVHDVLANFTGTGNSMRLRVQETPESGYNDNTFMVDNFSVTAVPAVAVPPPTGLVAWWRAESNALDSIGTNNGTLVNNATFAPGKVGTAFSFGGASDYVSVPSSPDVQQQNGLTLEAWVFAQGTPANQSGIAGTWDDLTGGNRTYFLWVQGGSLEFLISHGGGDIGRATDALPFPTNRWVHIVATFDGNFMQLYRDGVVVAAASYPGQLHTNGRPFFIGRTDSGSNGSDFWNGLIDEVSIYNRALSSNEVAAIYAAGSAGKISNQPYFLTAANLPNGAVGVLYSQIITASVTTGNTFSLIGGSLPAGLNLSTNGLISGTPAAAGTNSFAILATGSLGQTNSQAFVLAVFAPPVISAQPPGEIVTNGSPAFLAVGVSGSAPLFYQWQKNGINLTDGGNISGSSTNALSLIAATTNDAGNYSVIITNVGGSVTSSVVTLSVVSSATNQFNVSLPLATGSGNKLDLGLFAGGTVLQLSFVGHGDLVNSSYQTLPDGSLFAPAGSPYGYGNPGSTNYPTNAGGDGVNHYPGGGGIYDAGGGSGFPFAGKPTTDTTDPAGIRDGAVVGTFNPSPANTNWFDIGYGGTFTVPAGGAHLYVAVNDTVNSDDHGTYLGALVTTAAVSATSLVAHWTFDETNGVTAHDSTGSFDGTLNNAALFVANGISGGAVELASANSGYVNMGTNFPGFTTGNFSIVAWIKTTTTTANTAILSKHAAGSEDGYILELNQGGATVGDYGFAGRPYFYTSDSPHNEVDATNTVNDGAWHQIIVVQAAGVGRKIYVDGVLGGTGAAETIVGNTAPFLIGGVAVSGNPTGLYDGLVDDVQVYNQALNQGEVTQLYNHPGLDLVGISITSQPRSLTVTNGNPASFTVTASSISPLSYQWQKNGTNLLNGGSISGATNTTLNLSATITNDAGSYVVVITNAYGSVTSSGAALTVIAPAGGSTNGATNFIVLHTFSALNGSFANTDGANPYAGLVVSGGRIYGATQAGGTSGFGAIFAMDANGANFTNLHNFGFTGGQYPYGALVLSGNTLYGTAPYDSTNSAGMVFALNTDGGGFRIVHQFTGGSNDGKAPLAGVILSGGTLYGTTELGGSNNVGTVFSVNTNGFGFAILHNFAGGDGADPWAGLTLSGNTLYGTTINGGGFDDGGLFAVNTDGSGFTNLYSFTGGNDGASPYAGLVLSGNALYGTTVSGGSSGGGTLFAINTNGSGFTNLHTFFYTSDGTEPYAGLILSGNTLYGAAYNGGSSGNGTLFAVRADGSGFTNLYNFTGGNDGAKPYAGLILSGNTLYGTAYQGGTNGEGTAFALSVSTSTPLPVQIISPQVSGGSFNLSFQTVNGQGYTLLYNNNLATTNWLPYTNVSGNGGTLQLTVPITNATQRFFRLSEP